MTANQINVQFEIGLRSQLPDPKKVAGGLFYYALDTLELFALIRDPAGIILPAWELVSGPGGFDVKLAVITASTSPLPAYVATANTLTATVNGALPAIGGVILTAGQRVLIKNEVGADKPDNGIFVVVQAGDGSHPWILTRADDAIQGQLVSGSFVFVETGTLASTSWILTTPDPIVVGTTPLTWAQFAGIGTYTAAAPITLVGTVFGFAGTDVAASGAVQHFTLGSNSSAGGHNINLVADPIVGTDADNKESRDAAIAAATLTAQGPALKIVGTQIQEAGIAFQPTTTKIASYIATIADTQVDYDTTAGSFNITLPNATLAGKGFVLATQDVSGAAGTNQVTFLPNGSDTIELAPSMNNGIPFGSIAFESDGGSNWTKIFTSVDPQWKNPTLVATTVALPAYTVSASKQLLTANANGALPAIDGVTLTLNQTVLVTTGAADADNGLYLVQQVGSGGTPWILRRRADASITGRITQQTRVAVQKGTTYGGQVFVQTVAAPIVIGTTAQAWQSTTLSTFYVNPSTGNDANTGTAASPFLTWNTGVWPAIQKLRFTGVRVNYVGATADTSITATPYTLPVGVSVTFSSPWIDAGLGTRTATGASTTTSLVDSLGGLTINASQGQRTRFITGAMAGDVYSTMQNSATAFVPGLGGYRTTPANGDTFAIEQQSGGWSVGNLTAVFDATAPGANISFDGFLIVGTSVNTSIRIAGIAPRFNGFHYSCGTTGGGNMFVSSQGTSVWGRSTGIDLNSVSTVAPLGQQGVCCYIESTSGGGPNVGVGATSNVETWDLVMNNASWQSGGIEQHFGPRLNGISSNRTFFAMTNSPKCLISKASIIGCTGVSIRFFNCAASHVQQCAWDNTTTTTAVTCARSIVEFTSNTGTLGGASITGVNITDGSICQNNGGNTLTGPSGDLTVDGRVGLTWAAQTPTIQSSAFTSGTQINYSGGLTGGAGTTTVYIPFGGGVPSATNGTGNSPTAMRLPMSPGRLAKNLRLTVLTNSLASATVFTEMLAPVGTGVPAATTITLSVGATTTGTFSDTTHTAQYQDGDQCDLQAVNVAGGANPLTMTGALQAA